MLNRYEVYLFVSRHIVNKGGVYPVLPNRRMQIRNIAAVRD